MPAKKPIHTYGNIRIQSEIYRKLVEAEKRKSDGEKPIDSKLVFRKLKEKLRFAGERKKRNA